MNEILTSYYIDIGSHTYKLFLCQESQLPFQR